MRGAAAVALRSFATDAAAKQKLREALRPLLKDRDAEVRWAALDTFHELDPAAGSRTRRRDRRAAQRRGTARALRRRARARRCRRGSEATSARHHPLLQRRPRRAALRRRGSRRADQSAHAAGTDEPALSALRLCRPTAPQCASPPTAHPAASPMACSSSACSVAAEPPQGCGDEAHDKARATALLQDALKAPLLDDKLKAEITSRLAELKASR